MPLIELVPRDPLREITICVRTQLFPRPGAPAMAAVLDAVDKDSEDEEAEEAPQEARSR